MLEERFRKQRLVTKTDIVPLIEEVCRALGKHSPNAVQLLIGTAAAESSLFHRVQIGGGPALGLWGMEPNTALSIFENYLQYHPGIYWKLLQIWFDISPRMSGVMPVYMKPLTQDIIHHLQNDDAFAGSMARINYLRIPEAIPQNIEGQAMYWKKYHNIVAGKGTVEHYLRQWKARGCEKLLEVVKCQ